MNELLLNCLVVLWLVGITVCTDLFEVSCKKMTSKKKKRKKK